ncbi:STM4504/CBY_0614 family protein [Mongoliitalea lutea]|uniref:Abortive infection C-terminus n=1 Tax=Mongoliitalea lutea TaxID=849756 RepID=A0A8J3D1I2_9BACT|nr:hypothetical protein [Mongoliitalea lutea]GHB53999.1 hypothetical protein GCM10008106_37780 [Mongoliitalea lutea]
MAVFNIFSKRQKKLRGEVPDIFVYDKLPEPLRVQIVHIIRDAFGTDKGVYGHPSRPNAAFKFIHETLCKEYGVFTLGKGFRESDEECVLNHLLQTADIEKAMDVIELSFKYIDRIIKENFRKYVYDTEIKIIPDDAISELNDRFKEHGVGFQFESSEIIRVDSTIIHSEITKPTLSLLWDNKFKGANEEYLKAHEHYRHGRNKECLTECLKAFESTLKVICIEKGWAFNQTDTSKKLIQICFQNGLVPTFTQNQFTSLQNLLESGIPTIRNKLGGHGQGQVPQKVDDEMTRYGINLTGTNIIFLVEQSGIK